MKKYNSLVKIKFILSLIIIFVLIFPFNMLNISFNKYLINSVIILDTKMALISSLFVIYLVFYVIVNYIIKKNKEIDNKNKVINILLDEILIDGALIMLSSYGYINALICVTVVLKHLIINTLGIVDEEKLQMKVESLLLFIGIILKMIGNLPMGLINIALDDFFLISGSILCFISIIQYFVTYKKLNKNRG